jgi:hypothetical protein
MVAYQTKVKGILKQVNKEVEMYRRRLAWFPNLANRHIFAPQRSLAGWLKAGSLYLARNVKRKSCSCSR